MARVRNRQSGAGGRPKADRSIEALAQQHTDIAIHTLVEICGNPKATPSARVTAAGILLDRGWGKARQPIEHSGEMTHRYVVRAPSPAASAEEWLARHAPKAAEPA